MSAVECTLKQHLVSYPCARQFQVNWELIKLYLIFSCINSIKLTEDLFIAGRVYDSEDDESRRWVDNCVRCWWHCGAGSVHLSDVCPSVRLSLCHRPQHQTSQQQNLLLWLGRQEISIDCCTAHSSARRAAGECGQCHVVSVRSGLTQICLSRRETRFLTILFCGRFLSFSDFRGFLFLQPVLLCTRQNWMELI